MQRLTLLVRLIVELYVCKVMNLSKLILSVIGFLAFFTLAAQQNVGENLTASKEEFASKLGKQLGISNGTFERNDGQFDGDIAYKYASSTASVEFYKDKIIFGLRKVKRAHNPGNIEEPMLFDYLVWSVDLLGSHTASISAIGDIESSNISYFRANSKRASKNTANEILYTDVYPNVDLRFYTNTNGELKYDFILHPNARLSDIELKYTGVRNLLISDSGSLVYETDWGTIEEKKPFSYKQESEEEVEIIYSLDGTILTFDSELESIQETIIIDPIYVDWSSYFYGNGTNSSGFGYGYTWVYDLDIDSADNVYVTGITNDRFPGLTNSYDTSTNGYYDAYVCKMAPKGDSIIWFSYLGGSQYEYCFTLAVNNNQEPVVSGFTRSADFPITPGAFDETGNISGFSYGYAGFLTKFSSAGDSLLFSTYLSGNGWDLIQSMVIDDSNYVYLAGQTSSTDFPTTSGCYQSSYGGSTSSSYWNSGDAFLTKMNPTGTGLVFSTYFGGAGDDVAYDINISPNKDIYIVGKTSSSNFPVTSGSIIFNYNVLGNTDGFVAKFDPSGNSLQYSKMMGGAGDDWFEGVYVNERDEAYVAGISRSSDFYTSANAYQKTSNGGAEIVVVKFNPGGQNVHYSTYLGGSGDELYYSGFIYNSNVRIAANVREEPIICGISRSTDFPVTADALFSTNPSSSSGGSWNTSATITKLNFLGSKLLYGTYYGGSSFEVPGANKLKRISCYTNILYGGFTASSDYPTTSGVFKENKTGSSGSYFWTGFISKFRDTLYTDDIELNLLDTITQCDRIFSILDAKNIGADILWSNGSTNNVIFAQDTGAFSVTATYGCDTVRDTIYFIKEFSPTVPVLPADSVYCDLLPLITLDAQNDSILASYKWSTGDSTQTIQIDSAQTYFVDIITPRCGTKRDSVVYDFKKTPQATMIDDSVFCDAVSVQLVSGDSAQNEESFIWSTGDTSSFINVSDTGVYRVKITNLCGVDSSEIFITMIETPVVTLPADSEFCDNVELLLTFGLRNNEEYYTVTDLAQNLSYLTLLDSALVMDPSAFSISATNKCGESTDTIILSLITTPEVSLGIDSIFCDNMNYPLTIGKIQNKEAYLWDNGTMTNTRALTTEGVYWAQASNKCGMARDSIYVQIVESPAVSLPVDSIFCDNISLLLDADMDETISYLWSTGSTDSAVTIDAPGTYKVTLTNYCGTVSDSIKIDILKTPTVNLGKDKVFCGTTQAVEFTVGQADNDETYLWSNGSVGNTVTLYQAIEHWVSISNKCATARDTILFTLSDNPTVDLGEDTTLCGNFSLLLDAGNPGMQYLWMPYGQATKTIQATEQITYTVTVSNEYGCEGTGSFTVRPDCVSKSFIPSAFTPNGDGLNDIFRPTLINFEDYSLVIYNRWGEKIFESEDSAFGWDGTYNGAVVQNGVYSFVMRYKTTEDLQWQNVGGVVNVVR